MSVLTRLLPRVPVNAAGKAWCPRSLPAKRTVLQSLVSRLSDQRQKAGLCKLTGGCRRVLICAVAGFGFLNTAIAGDSSDRPRLFLHENYMEDVLRTSSLPISDPMAVFGYVLGNLPGRVKVYPTENYYYFSFIHNSTRYAGNIRLDTVTRDQGKVHFAYYKDLAEWKNEDPITYVVLDKSHGVAVEKLDRLVYRITFDGKSVVFELNDLSGVVPPPGVLAPEERYIGPIFDDSGVRFFLIYNHKLKIFHYLLDETIRVADEFDRAVTTDRILIGKRTGFAFYRDHKRNRKILIGVFEGNARINNYFDGPFDQLPDNFIEGEALRSAILEVEPSLAGHIDRFGSSPDGTDRYMIAPYVHYRSEEDLLIFHSCAENKKIPAEMYYACFVFDPEPQPVTSSQTVDTQRGAATKSKVRKRTHQSMHR
jgi:hypothetical protein